MTRAPELVLELEQGARIALVTDAGMPGISDPGFRLVSLAIRHHLPVVPVPGAAAFLAAFVVYEGSLFAVSFALASGVSDYAPSIVWRIFAINTAAFAALFLVHRLLEGKPKVFLAPVLVWGIMHLTYRD